MRRENEVVRVRKISRTNEDESRWVYKIYLTTFKKYTEETSYTGYGERTELFPYKWFEIQSLWERPTFITQEILSKRRFAFAHKIKIPMQITIFSIESLTIWGIIKIAIGIFEYFSK